MLPSARPLLVHWLGLSMTGPAVFISGGGLLGLGLTGSALALSGCARGSAGGGLLGLGMTGSTLGRSLNGEEERFGVRCVGELWVSKKLRVSQRSKKIIITYMCCRCWIFSFAADAAVALRVSSRATPSLEALVHAIFPARSKASAEAPLQAVAVADVVVPGAAAQESCPRMRRVRRELLLLLLRGQKPGARRRWWRRPSPPAPLGARHHWS